MSDKLRRKVLKSIAAGSGAIAVGKSLPESWSRPVVESVLLPAHAQTSIQCPAPSTVIITGTATQMWTVPTNICGPITIVAYGASGNDGDSNPPYTGGSGGPGGNATVTLIIPANTVLSIDNGGQGGGSLGGTGDFNSGGGGGGYTEVSYGLNALYAAGGGGGGGSGPTTFAGNGGAGGDFEAGQDYLDSSGGASPGTGGAGGNGITTPPAAGTTGTSGSGGGGGGGFILHGGAGGAGGEGSATGTFASASPVFARSSNVGDGYVEITFSVM